MWGLHSLGVYDLWNKPYRLVSLAKSIPRRINGCFCYVSLPSPTPPSSPLPLLPSLLPSPLPPPPSHLPFTQKVDILTTLGAPGTTFFLTAAFRPHEPEENWKKFLHLQPEIENGLEVGSRQTCLFHNFSQTRCLSQTHCTSNCISSRNCTTDTFPPTVFLWTIVPDLQQFHTKHLLQQVWEERVSNPFAPWYDSNADPRKTVCGLFFSGSETFQCVMLAIYTLSVYATIIPLLAMINWTLTADTVSNAWDALDVSDESDDVSLRITGLDSRSRSFLLVLGLFLGREWPIQKRPSESRGNIFVLSGFFSPCPIRSCL